MRETNLFKLGGLETVGARYQLYEINGALEIGPEYYSGVTRLQRLLSRKHQAAFASIRRGDRMLLAAPEAVCQDIELNHNLGRWVANLNPVGDTLEIDCSVSGDQFDPIRMRFLNFMLQSPLFENRQLWQPRAGDAFYYRRPADTRQGVELFEGVSVRAAPYPGGGFGVILEARTKLISAHSIGAKANANDIRRLKGSSCLYRMGGIWYEIKVAGAGQSVSTPIIHKDGQLVSLKQYIHQHLPHPLPKRIANLQGDGAVVTYRGSDSAEVKAAPAELCYLVLDTHSKRGAKLQRETIQSPAARRTKVFKFKKRFLSDIRIGNAHISVADQSAPLENRTIDLPDLAFGNGGKLRGIEPAQKIPDIQRYAKQRRALLEKSGVGFHEQSPLDPQSLILPQSVLNAWGPKFVDDFVCEVRRLHPGSNYDPTVIGFDDLNMPITSQSQASAILSLAKSGQIPSSDCAIMVHTQKGKARHQDQLPAFLINQLRNTFGINASVFHTGVPERAYRQQSAESGSPYTRKHDAGGRYAGYLKGAALNKVLLPNAKWPFVLSNELVADIIIGIDVKHHTAALVLVAEGGKVIRHMTETSTKREKLPAGLVETKLIQLLREEADKLGRLTKSITIHRDGRAWPTELKGLERACQHLAEEGLIAEDYELNVFEIAKSSPAPLRFYNVEKVSGQKPKVLNPTLGEWMALTDDEGYVCTTGAPLLRGGTARPLHVRRTLGEMDLRDALGDIFRLSCLNWTRPESCSRLPVSLKLCDTLLMDRGAEHDETDFMYANDDEDGEEKAA